MNLDIGVCIYCGARNVPLTREHVLPRGLGGSASPEGMADALVLQKASCGRCQQITQKIEKDCLTLMMDSAREKLGMKRKDRVKNEKKASLKLNDNSMVEQFVSWDSIPGVMIIPAFHTAGCFKGSPIDAPLACDYKVIIVEPARAKLSGDVAEVGVELAANPVVFAQMLAKIALGAAVAEYGYGNFEPFIQNVILKDGLGWGYWIGGYADTDHVEEDTNSFHSINIWHDDGPDGRLIMASIRLFAEYGAPANYVLVGRLDR